MSVSNLCGICEAEAAVEQCSQCGTPVCRQHYHPAASLCVECASGAETR